MNTIKEILEAYGTSVEEMDVNEHYLIEVDGYEPLAIEKVREDIISVEQYYTQRMDRMSDPEIRFKIGDAGEWTAVEYTDHGMNVYQRDERGLRSANEFAIKWDRNLRDQGFIDAAYADARNGGEQ
ncbi:hypothetical protein G3I44_14045 [Halogeometricum borinquense]|uniref:DUF6908 domain-containing protein n=1 Tax=Halogeometricum borinquense TaxID=60847 RepID=A0A6C0UQT8_9EURY|nr:hypothetical protein [Halogeometricum borinquense]QIB75308.1 hypothetical protein G3I44_14045 [Halogeometricum borinquense]